MSRDRESVSGGQALLLKLKLKGGGQVTLNKRDFVASGGEGSVYAKGQTAYKIYKDPKRMIPLAKIDELTELDAPTIIRPLRVLLDQRNRPVGYTMRYVRDTYALCQLFTRAFKQRNNISPDQILNLVRQHRQGVQDVHDAGILIVDLNEMNFLVDAAFTEIYFIDVDSYQTQSFPATAIMPNVRDYFTEAKLGKTKGYFNKDTDWFSWAIVTFQLFMGIHPYKGKHPSVKKLEDRMRQNLSVFHQGVSIPKMCPPLDVIPRVYRDWYRAVFEDGLRCAPPVGFDVQPTTIAPVFQRMASTDQLNVQVFATFDAAVIDYFYADGHAVAATTAGIRVGKRKYPAVAQEACFGVAGGHTLAAWVVGGWLHVYDLTERHAFPIEYRADDVLAYAGALYVKNDACVHHLVRTVNTKHSFLTLAPVANVMTKATAFFAGVAMQNMLGAWWATIFPRPGACYLLHLKQLREYRIVDARYDNRILMVVGVKEGQYDRFVFTIHPDYQGYNARVDEDVAYAGLNFVTLENGVCAHITEEDKLELFTNTTTAQGAKVVQDPLLHNGLRLYKQGTTVLFAEGPTLYKISTRKQ